MTKARAGDDDSTHALDRVHFRRVDEPAKPDTKSKPPIADDYGLRCPRCGCRDLRVLETRRTWKSRVKRRRECRHCARRTTTFEK